MRRWGREEKTIGINHRLSGIPTIVRDFRRPLLNRSSKVEHLNEGSLSTHQDGRVEEANDGGNGLEGFDPAAHFCGVQSEVSA